MKFAVDFDISGAVKLTNAIAKQIPFAMAKALTQTAIQAQTDIVQAMTQGFDRPTPYTLNSTYISPATKDRLEATVKLKNESAKGLPATKYLAPEVFGGNRNAKRSEVALRNLLNLDAGSFIVPGAAVPLDQYGNISAGTMTKILSAVQANPDYCQNVTQKSRRRAIAAGRNLDYFVGRSAVAQLHHQQRRAQEERDGIRQYDGQRVDHEAVGHPQHQPYVEADQHKQREIADRLGAEGVQGLRKICQRA